MPVATTRAGEALLGTPNGSKGRWILFGDHREAWTELALTGVSDGSPFNVIIDRVFVDAEDTLWIVDYKSSRHEGSGLEAFLDSEQERYESQLRRYATVINAWHPGMPVKLALYFPLMSAWREF